MEMRRHLQTRDRGFEKVDPMPHELMEEARPLSIREELKRFVRSEMLAARAAAQGAGTFEEEDDFEEDEEDPDLLSPYQVVMMVKEDIDEESLEGNGGEAPEEVPAKSEVEGKPESDAEGMSDP